MITVSAPTQPTGEAEELLPDALTAFDLEVAEVGSFQLPSAGLHDMCGCYLSDYCNRKA